jgi:hypothetical protein
MMPLSSPQQLKVDLSEDARQQGGHKITGLFSSRLA